MRLSHVMRYILLPRSSRPLSVTPEWMYEAGTECPTVIFLLGDIMVLYSDYLNTVQVRPKPPLQSVSPWSALGFTSESWVKVGGVQTQLSCGRGRTLHLDKWIKVLVGVVTVCFQYFTFWATEYSLSTWLENVSIALTRIARLIMCTLHKYVHNPRQGGCLLSQLFSSSSFVGNVQHVIVEHSVFNYMW